MSPSSAPTERAAFQKRVCVRQYVPEDHAAVVQMFVNGMRSYDGHQGPGNAMYIKWSLETDMADIVGTYITPGGNFWVATLEDGEIVGMIAYQKKEADGEGELRRLSVKSEYKRFGLGKFLVAHLETWAKANGFKTVTLNTGTVMHDAIAFYHKIGYTLTKIENTSGHYELQYFEKSEGFSRVAPIAHTDSPSTISLRQYVPQDRDAVVELFRDGMMHYTNEDDPQYSVWENYVTSSMESDLADIEGVYLNNGGNFWVAVATGDGDQTVAGTLAIEKKQPDGVGESMRVSVHSAVLASAACCFTARPGHAPTSSRN
ncbi:N-acetyltransferase cml2, partial [Globisporangium splendens]